MKIVVGSRGSKLAITQTEWVIGELKKVAPVADFEIKIIKTKGDKIQNVALDKIGDKGLFVKEIESELLGGTIDIAVHSMKDMPSVMPKGLKLCNTPKREDFRDVLILREGLKSLDDVPNGGKIGTGSKRRQYQILRYRPDIEIVPIRGNIDTRIRKIDDEHLDGIILAAAGVKRMGLTEKISCYLSENIMLPSPAQGALAIQIKECRKDLEDIIDKIADRNAQIQVTAERTFLEAVNGGCHIPIGALCTIEGDRIKLDGLLGTTDGGIIIRKTMDGIIGEEEKIAKDLAYLIMKEIGSNER
ncbi:hydroxymethylbilane synthase [Brassicibacter mesophilus]|uniref:hydroxymethylbilane synthase n=1 Tax=Brassicibacter mesophilus TaxID=745119 RepID=UPI003D1AF639